MNKLCRIAFATCILTVTVAGGQLRRSSYDPAPQRPPHQRKSLIDFALNQINPTNKDYGQGIEQARKRIIDAGLHNFTAVSSLALMIFSFFVILHQNQERKHREIIAARFLAWYHNELVRSRETANDAIRRNQQLKILMDEVGGTGPALNTAGGLVDISPQGAAGAESASIPSGPKKAPWSDGDLVTEISRLRQRVVSQEETEKVLRQQASQLNRRLQEEKQKNRTLKGE